ncbi:MTAP family purine nucleoside phosphorylase [Rhizobium sp. FKL33]|uniref:phosphorylase family protein n=1 Tax=Rhizobium sp. FKL33 TaxID=2562307 RepID=UPI0010BFDD62|nr:MTAP family purine nucleoside phosphorylase [Rhizobium sp. FKL33]
MMIGNIQECYYVHPDNIKTVREQLNLRVAVVARPDWFLKESGARQLIVETPRGIHNRIFLAEYGGIPFVVAYGRFNRVRGTSADIDYELTQEVFSFLGIETIVGTFVCGAVGINDKSDTVYIPDSFIGFGNYNQTRNRKIGFRNPDMSVPFCPILRDRLVHAAEKAPFEVKTNGVYASFHGYPRIPTAAEYDFFERNGCQMVGQSMDGEATLAKEAGCHYAAVTVTIEDRAMRARMMVDDRGQNDEVHRITREGRKKTFNLFLDVLSEINELSNDRCNCREQGERVRTPSKDFYYRPGYLRVDQKVST